MGAYGALNLGTKHRDVFSTIGALGGPVDLQQLLRDSIDDNLEVKAQTTIPREVAGSGRGRAFRLARNMYGGTVPHYVSVSARCVR